jgi:hypothetical protein
VRDFWHVLNIFNSPAGVLTPLGVLPSAFLAAGLFLTGCLSLAATNRAGRMYLLTAPILVALLASGMHQYPFHCRLILFLAPLVHLLVAEGTATITRTGRGWLTLALALFLLVSPATDCLWHHLIQKRTHSGYDTHGDLKHDLLDYLEWLELHRQVPQALP